MVKMPAKAAGVSAIAAAPFTQASRYVAEGAAHEAAGNAGAASLARGAQGGMVSTGVLGAIGAGTSAASGLWSPKTAAVRGMEWLAGTPDKATKYRANYNEQMDTNGNIYPTGAKKKSTGVLGFKCGGVLKKQGGSVNTTATADSTKYYSDKVNKNINEFTSATRDFDKQEAAKKTTQSKNSLMRQDKKGKPGFDKNGFPLKKTS